MIDIHAHILPGVDDGAESLEDSLRMAEIAVRSGTTAMACTVHSNQIGRFENYESEILKDSFRRLSRAIKEEGIPLTLVRGMEIFHSDDLVERIQRGDVISLNKYGCYLVEFHFTESPVVIRECIQDMLHAGFHPVIAHPERYFCVQDNPNYLYEWRQMGALAQLNKSSVFGGFGEQERKTARLLLKHRMVNCVASDAHGYDYRTPIMEEIREYLEKDYSEEYSELLLEVNPSRMLMGKPVVEDEPPIPAAGRSRFY